MYGYFFNRSTQHLWNLLQGRILLLSEDCVSEELKDNLDRIVAGLTYYAAYQEETEGEQQVVFPTAPSLFRYSVVEDKEQETRKTSSGGGGGGQEGDGGGTTTGQGDSKRKSGQGGGDAGGGNEVSSFDMVRKAVAQKLVRVN